MSWLKRMMGGKSSEAARPSAPAPAPTPTFVPINDIERLLMDAAVRPEARPAFERALLDVPLYAATPDVPETAGERTVGEGETLQLFNVESPEGTAVAAIFTAQERIADFFQRETGFVAIKGEDLLTIVAGHGAWLNPGASYGVYWSPADLAAILGKSVPRTIERDTQIMLGTPAEPPLALIAALRSVLSGDDRIADAWFALAHWPDGTAAWYLDVRTALDAPAVQALLAETFRRADYAGRALDMVVNPPGGRDGTGIRVAPAGVL